MTIPITGATGFIGSHLADRPLPAGHGVVGVDKRENGVAEPTTRLLLRG